jgi:hypothetical protein
MPREHPAPSWVSIQPGNGVDRGPTRARFLRLPHRGGQLTAMLTRKRITAPRMGAELVARWGRPAWYRSVEFL